MIRFLVILGCLSVSSPLFAQSDDAGPTAEDKSQAKRLVGEAQAAFNSGDYESCAQKFSTAHKLVPLPQIQFNLGLCYERLKQYRNAATVYESAAGHQDMPEAMRAKAEENLAQVRAQLGKVQITGREGESRVDDSILCKMPCTLYLKPGSHVVAFGSNGDSQTFTTKLGEQTDVKLAVKAVENTVDATEPPSNSRPDLVSNDVQASSTSSGSGIGLLTWGGGGLAVAGTVGAVVFGLKTQSLHDDFAMMPTQALADDGEEMRGFTNLSIGAAILGVSLVAYDLLIN